MDLSAVDINQIKQWFAQFKELKDKGPSGEVINLFLETIDRMLESLNMSVESSEAYQVKWQLLQALLLEVTADFWKTIGVERFTEEIKPYLSAKDNPEAQQEKILELFKKYSEEYQQKRGHQIWVQLRDIGTNVLDSFIKNLGNSISEEQKESLRAILQQYSEYDLSGLEKPQE